MRVFVTGVGGYLGSILVRLLLEGGHDVLGIDNFLYDNEFSLKEIKKNKNFELIKGDLTKKEVLNKIMKEHFDVVIHLAAIVGQPACSLNIERAFKVNYELTENLVKLLSKKQIKNFIFASTCSVYGKANSLNVDESSKTIPLDSYGQMKLQAEEMIKNIGKFGFPFTILRFATNYGLSYRMRFDLVVNFFIKNVALKKPLTILGGNQWRPFIDVNDSAKAFSLVLSNPNKSIGQTFNVGSSEQNLTISELAKIIQQVLPNTKFVHQPEIQDHRSYTVDFSKIQTKLGFQPEATLEDSILQVYNAIKGGKLGDPNNPRYYNIPL